MKITLKLLLIILGLVFTALAAAKVPDRWVNWGWAGVFCFALAVFLAP